MFCFFRLVLAFNEYIRTNICTLWYDFMSIGGICCFQSVCGIGYKTIFLIPNKQTAKVIRCTFHFLCDNIIIFATNKNYGRKHTINSSTEWHEIAEIVTENTNKSDLITVCGNRNIVYLLSDRKSASKYSYQYPIAEINPNIKTEYLDDIRQLKAKMIIVEKDYFLYDNIMDVVEQNYMLLETINSTHIYLRNS